MPKTSVLIVDDHRVVVQGIRSALDELPEFEVVGEAFDGRQALKLAESLKPDIVVMDISMPELNGIEATVRLRKILPKTRIVIFTMHADKEFVIDLFRVGVSAYVLKDDPLSDLVLALKAVKSGGTYFSTMAPTILIRHMETLEKNKTRKDLYENLSFREREVFQLLAEGKTIKKIAGRLCISPKTVESHKYNIMSKLDIDSMTELIKYAIRKKVITL